MIKLFENFKNVDSKQIKKQKDSYDFLLRCFNFFEKIIDNDDQVKMNFFVDEQFVSIMVEGVSVFTVLINHFMVNSINIYYDKHEVFEKYPFIFKYMYKILSEYLEQNNFFRRQIDNIDSWFNINKEIDNINFNLEDYERFKDTERFGL